MEGADAPEEPADVEVSDTSVDSELVEESENDRESELEFVSDVELVVDQEQTKI